MTAVDTFQGARFAMELATAALLTDPLSPLALLEVYQAIDSALAVPALPDGTAMQQLADACRKAAGRCQAVSTDMADITASALPAAWHGQAGGTALEAVQAVSAEVAAAVTNLDSGAAALADWIALIREQYPADQAGLAQLRAARAMLAPGGFAVFGDIGRIVADARSGIDARLGAAEAIADQQQGQNASGGTAALLDQYASLARARDVSTPDVDAITAIELATAAGPGDNGTSRDVQAQIVSPEALARASQVLDGMSATDQQAFEKLLAGCKSPQEAAYLWQALGAGNSLSEVESFDGAIRPHGGDPDWLDDHLGARTLDQGGGPNQGWDMLAYQGSPGAGDDPNQNAYEPDLYDQGNVNDCVAASTVMAAAMNDPVLMLGLTTGYGQPAGSHPAPGDDSAAALTARLQQMYDGQYFIAQVADGGMPNIKGGGITSTGENVLANNLLGQVTGNGYAYQNLGSTQARQAAVPAIRTAVEAGKPVPFDVTDGSNGHQMVIIGYRDGQFEVYNPWGFTSWVNENQFVDGHLGDLTISADGSATGLPNADGIELPK